MAWEWLTNIGGYTITSINNWRPDNVPSYVSNYNNEITQGNNPLPDYGNSGYRIYSHTWNVADTTDLVITNINNGSQLQIRLYINGESTALFQYNGGGGVYGSDLAIGINYDTEEAAPVWLTQSGATGMYMSNPNVTSEDAATTQKRTDLYTVLMGLIPPAYNWSSVPAVSGSMGILSLTEIVDDKITEGDASHTVLPEEYIERFTDQSNTRRICLNHVKDEWFRAAESGLNYLELKYSILNPSYPNDMTIQYRFINHYGEGNNQYYSIVFSGTLYFTGQANGQSDTYLSFVIDEENEVAMFDPVTWIKMPSSTPPIYGVEYGNISHTSNDMASIYYWLKGTPEDVDEDDPYAGGSEGDGGDGNPYQPQDHLGLSSKPAESGLDVGIVTLYQPSKTELAAISQFLWSDDVLDNFKKYFNNFGDNLLSLMILPVEQEAAGIASKAFTVGNMTSDNATLQSVNYITDRYVDIDMGSFYLKRKWDSYLDVSPYSKLEVYLPYCGTHQLNTDEVVYPANSEGFLPVKPDQEIQLKLNYRIDLVTGNIVATLFVNDENRYQFTGKCGITVPLTGANYQNMVTGAITAGAGLAATIASGGLTAPLSGAAAVSGTVMAQKPDVYRSGNLSGDVSMLAFDTPYLIKTIPNKPVLTNQELYTGFPSYKKGTLGEFSGYTEVIEAHIDDVSCTSEERDMIMAALKGGVII